MTYEKAELILQQLMAGDREYHLVQTKEGKPYITDRPTKQQRIVGTLPKRKRVVKTPLCNITHGDSEILC